MTGVYFVLTVQLCFYFDYCVNWMQCNICSSSLCAKHSVQPLSVKTSTLGSISLRVYPYGNSHTHGLYPYHKGMRFPVTIWRHSVVLLHSELHFLTVTDRTGVHNGALVSLCPINTLWVINGVIYTLSCINVAYLKRYDELAHILSVRRFTGCQQCVTCLCLSL
jgi:hypothetical protein